MSVQFRVKTAIRCGQTRQEGNGGLRNLTISCAQKDPLLSNLRHSRVMITSHQREQTLAAQTERWHKRAVPCQQEWLRVSRPKCRVELARRAVDRGAPQAARGHHAALPRSSARAGSTTWLWLQPSLIALHLALPLPTHKAVFPVESTMALCQTPSTGM